MHSVFTRPWKYGTILIVLVLVLGLPLAISSYLNYKGLIAVDWALISWIIAATLFVGSLGLDKLWKPAKWMRWICWLFVASATSLSLEPVGQFTFDGIAWAYLLAISGGVLYMWSLEYTKRWNPAKWFTGIGLLIVAGAISLIKEPEGRFTFSPDVWFFLVTAVVLQLVVLARARREAVNS